MADLLARLERRGLGPPLVRLEADRIAYSDQLELVHSAGTYRVAEVERGMVLAEYCLTADGEEALAAFADSLAGRSVFLASFASEYAAERLRRDLERHGIRAWPNHVLTLQDTAPLYRLFVPAPDWRRARDLLGAISERGETA